MRADFVSDVTNARVCDGECARRDGVRGVAANSDRV